MNIEITDYGVGNIDVTDGDRKSIGTSFALCVQHIYQKNITSGIESTMSVTQNQFNWLVDNWPEFYLGHDEKLPTREIDDLTGDVLNVDFSNSTTIKVHDADLEKMRNDISENKRIISGGMYISLVIIE